jgi:uncharacterized protein YjiS (DUF1127 family)
MCINVNVLKSEMNLLRNLRGENWIEDARGCAELLEEQIDLIYKGLQGSS